MAKPTRVIVPKRDDLKKSHDFKVGDRVTLREGHFNPKVESQYRTGVVVRVPNGPIAKIGRHVIGNEMSVDLDAGCRAVANVDHWEHVKGGN